MGALDAVKTRNETAGNERERIGTRRTETAGKPLFCLVKEGFESP
jgi:hypothetical protein